MRARASARSVGWSQACAQRQLAPLAIDTALGGRGQQLACVKQSRRGDQLRRPCSCAAC